MLTHHRSLACRLTAYLFPALLLFAFASGAAAEKAAVWLPPDAFREVLPAGCDLLYDGLAGRVVGADPGALTVLEGRGGRLLDLKDGEVFYVFLVEDADRAEFDSPARVLLRTGHEVFLATPEREPRLTAASGAGLSGLKQPVLITRRPIAWPAEIPGVPEGSGASPAPPPPAQPRDIDPLIQQMVTSLTEESYLATWQTLDDFETRYYNTPQNEQATQWILDRFHAYGLSAQFHLYQQGGQRRNVIATLPGLVDPSKVVYICGHLDAISDTPTVCAPGADDNGSGTNAVLEAARILSQYRFQYTIKFACFNGEEQGLVGSGAYVADIAQQGENVIAVYNCDMIAYRGTDTAPPDLVIYTNTASQSLATTLTTAIQTYTPGQLEPVVLVEALDGSDHASFWAHGYKAICAIEDEAWGSDFCPWYHTCNDRIERYPHDYPTYCARANLAAVAMTALPLNPAGPFLVFGSSLIDDDAAGGSSGNGDGLLNPGETIELWVTVQNVGQGPATHVHGHLSSESGDVTVLTPDASWNDVPPGGQGMNLTAMRFRVHGTATDGEALPFTLTMTDDSGSRELSLQFTVVAPNLAHYAHRVDDVTAGNGNGVPDPGEVVLLPVTLINRGAQDAADVHALLSSGSFHLTVLAGEAGCPSVPSGGQADLTPPFRVAISADALVGEILPLNLALTAGSGYETVSTFKIKVGSAFFDDAEAAGAWSLEAIDDDATTGRWTQVDPNGTTYNGQQCQPEDDHTPAPGIQCFVTGQGTPGGAAGENDVDGGKTTLTSPTMDLTRVVDPRLTYWRWYTNNLGNNPNEDYWVVQISSNGGATWVDLERTTESANSWLQRTFALAGVIVPTNQVVVRFVASDEINNSLVEAAVDDIEISGTTSPVAVGEVVPPMALRLDPARPSPSHETARFSLALPQAGPAVLEIFRVDGRLLRTLWNGSLEAGLHQVNWDGRDAGGVPAATGVYFCRLRAGGQERTQRLVVVR